MKQTDESKRWEKYNNDLSYLGRENDAIDEFDFLVSKIKKDEKKDKNKVQFDNFIDSVKRHMPPKFGPTPNYPLALALVGTDPHQHDNSPIVIAGPCSIESHEQIDTIFDAIKDDITYMRGGVFRAGTYPGEDWGLKMDLLKDYHAKAFKIGKPNIVDVLDVRNLICIDQYSGAFQVGARQAQNYVLLKELGRQSKPVILKRGTHMTIDELLGSLEYILQGGNTNVILCERGGVSYLDHTRWELSISLIAKLKDMGLKFPVIVDASHGTGDANLVAPMTYAGLAAGADGYLVEVHNDPKKSLSDKEQAISIKQFKAIKEIGDKIWKI